MTPHITSHSLITNINNTLNMSNQIYFTADLHFGHANILKHSPKRPYSDTVDIKAHDEWLLDLWRSTVDKRDTIYILGDLTFLKSEDARHLQE